MTRWTLPLLLLAVVVGLVGCVSPDETPPVPPGGLREVVEYPPVDPAVEAWFRDTRAVNANLMVVGDRIRIDIQEHVNLSIAREVPPDGVIPLFSAGGNSVNALHKNPQQLEKEVQAAYADVYPNLYVTVTVEIAAPRHVYVAGAVSANGRQTVASGERLDVLKAITQAGGASPDADLTHVTIRRMHPQLGEVVTSPPLDIKKVLELGDHADNLVLLPDDQLVVPKARFTVSILGQVEDPGNVRWEKGLTLSQAVTERGGFKRFAKKAAIKIVRASGETMLIDYDKILEGTNPELYLDPQDVVFIPEKWL